MRFETGVAVNVKWRLFVSDVNKI